MSSEQNRGTDFHLEFVRSYQSLNRNVQDWFNIDSQPYDGGYIREHCGDIEWDNVFANGS